MRLGDVVENINEFFDRNSGDELRYVAGEHLDEGDLQVKRYGLISEDLVPPTFKRLFQAGDVLFHSRNIRKLAQPAFDGLTGEKLFVLRTRDPSKLMQDFLPYLLQSDDFQRYVDERWAGSTNKFLNKTPLMAYEFILPSIHEQIRAVRTLSAASDVRNSLYAGIEAARLMRRAGLVSIFASEDRSPASSEMSLSVLRQGWRLATASEICVSPITKGATPSGATGSADTGIPFLKVYNLMFDGSLDFSVEPTFLNAEAHSKDLARSKVLPGDILMNIVGPPLGKVSIVPQDFPEANINQAIARFRVRGDIPPRYVAAYLLSEWAQRWFRTRSKKTSGQQNLTLELCQTLPVPLPPSHLMDGVISRIDALFEAVRVLETRRSTYDTTYSKILMRLIDDV